MIQFVRGNIFESEAQTIVNPVNCVGVMGAGLALKFKQKYPRMFSLYKNVCKDQLLRPGKLMIVHEPDHNILLFPTKDHWKDLSSLEYIHSGLKNFAATYKQRGIESVAFPPLGCGLGGLNWNEVKQIFIDYLSELPIQCYVYEK